MKKCLECEMLTKNSRKFCSTKCSAVFRERNTCLITKENLINEYIDQKLEVVDISHNYGVSVNTVYNYLKRYGIDKRGCHIDFSGKKIGKLLIIEPLEVGHKGGGKHIRWKCVCDCGNEVLAYSHHLSRSIGVQCRICTGKKHRSELELKVYMWTGIKRGATSRNINFDISREWAYDLFLKQNRKCNLSGVDICFAECAADFAIGKTTASLDRIDSSKGYVKDNVQWVHKVVNVMKWHLDQNAFIDWCNKISEKSK